jgi:hypothetical protein
MLDIEQQIARNRGQQKYRGYTIEYLLDQSVIPRRDFIIEVYIPVSLNMSIFELHI